MILKLTNFLDKYLISYNGERYYKIDDLYLLSTKEVIENKLLSDVTYFNIKNISEYLSDIEEDYLTIYKDNSFSIGYTIPVNSGVLSFEINESSSFVTIIISGNENIDKVDISFNDYYIKSISLSLSNINNIEDIEVD